MPWYSLGVPGPFDNTTRYLVETYPRDWLTYLGVEVTGPVQVIDANLTTVSAEVDKVMRIEGEIPTLVHVEFQSTYDPTMGKRMLRYNAMLHHDTDLGVNSTLVLLRPAADGPSLTGEYRVSLPHRRNYMHVEYAVRRVWQELASTLLDGTLGTLPLAPLGAIERESLPTLLRAMDLRFVREAPVAEADRLRVVTYTLLGLSYPRGLIDQLMPGFQHMRDSVTYQAILNEGRVEGRSEGLAEGLAEGRADEARALLVYLGTRRFGSPDTETRDRLDSVQNPDLLDAWCRRVLDAASWDDLLATS